MYLCFKMRTHEERETEDDKMLALKSVENEIM